MKRKIVPYESLLLKPFDMWANKWFLLAAGDFKSRKFNVMTVAWGSFGTIWNKPFAQIFVRPTRYTHEFTENFPYFTLSAFSEKYKEELQLLGSKSGRDEDKLAETGLTPEPSTKVDAPSFKEASIVLECRKIYKDEMNPKGFMNAEIMSNYPGERNFHTIYFGEILAITASDKFV